MKIKKQCKTCNKTYSMCSNYEKFPDSWSHSYCSYICFLQESKNGEGLMRPTKILYKDKTGKTQWIEVEFDKTNKAFIDNMKKVYMPEDIIDIVMDINFFLGLINKSKKDRSETNG